MAVSRSALRGVFAGLALIAALLFACGGSDDGGGVTLPPAPSPDPGAITGSVRDAGGQGVPGATLTLSRTGATTRTTTSDGAGSFSFGTVDPGVWQVGTAPPAGFQLAPGQANPVSVTVSSAQTATLTVAVVEDLPATTGGIEGFARLQGQGVQGVVAELANAAGPLGSVTTSSDGRFVFQDVEAGDYTVTVTLPVAFRLVAGEEAAKQTTVVVGETAALAYAVELAQASPVVEVTLQTGPNRFAGPGGSTTTVARGTTVRWVNSTSLFHTVTPDGHDAWQRATTSGPGTVLEVLLINPGTFPYFCEPHRATGMTGTVIVQ